MSNDFKISNYYDFFGILLVLRPSSYTFFLLTPPPVPMTFPVMEMDDEMADATLIFTSKLLAIKVIRITFLVLWSALSCCKHGSQNGDENGRSFLHSDSR